MSLPPQHQHGSAPKQVDPAIAAISGTIATISSSLMAAPLSRVMNIWQTQHVNPQITENTRYFSYWDTIKRIYKEQGLLSYWRGASAAVTMNIAASISANLAKDALKSQLPKVDPRKDKTQYMLVNLAGGVTAGLLTSLFTYPFDVAYLKLSSDIGNIPKLEVQRLAAIQAAQAAQAAGTTATEQAAGAATESVYARNGVAIARQYSGIADVMKSVMAVDGFTGLYRGLIVSMGGIIAYRALYFGLYDGTKHLFIDRTVNPSQNFWKHFAFGYAVTFTTGILTFPFSVVRKRMMMMTDVPKENKKYKGAISCVSYMIRAEGYPSLWRGLLLHLIKSPGVAAVLASYDAFIKPQFFPQKGPNGGAPHSERI